MGIPILLGQLYIESGLRRLWKSPTRQYLREFETDNRGKYNVRVYWVQSYETGEPYIDVYLQIHPMRTLQEYHSTHLPKHNKQQIKNNCNDKNATVQTSIYARIIGNDWQVFSSKVWCLWDIAYYTWALRYQRGVSLHFPSTWNEFSWGSKFAYVWFLVRDL